MLSPLHSVHLIVAALVAWSTLDGASLIQWTCGTGTNQQWSGPGS